MSASKIHPNMYKGAERSGGYIRKNDRPKSANSPEWRGRIYLVGVGWYWLSAWVKDTPTGPLVQLRAQEMKDEDASKYCAPKGEPTKSTKRNGGDLFEPEPEGDSGGEIPF